MDARALAAPGRRADNVYDMAEWRGRLRPQPLPPEVVEQMDFATRLADALLAQGHEVRFELPSDGGRVRAELRSVGGDVVRAVGLHELVVDPSDPPGPPVPPASAA